MKEPIKKPLKEHLKAPFTEPLKETLKLLNGLALIIRRTAGSQSTAEQSLGATGEEAFRVQGLELKGLRFRVEGLGFRV